MEIVGAQGLLKAADDTRKIVGGSIADSKAEYGDIQRQVVSMEEFKTFIFRQTGNDQLNPMAPAQGQYIRSKGGGYQFEPPAGKARMAEIREFAA